MQNHQIHLDNNNSKLFFRFEYNYIHQINKRPWIGNAGDMFQTFAVINLYKKAGINLNDITPVNRDEIGTYQGKPGTLIMQGYYERTPQMNAQAKSIQMPASKNINPVFLGFHIADKKYYTRHEAIEYYQRYMPIGCRDRLTALLLKSFDINAYFSSCLTLTFDKREKKDTQNKIFIVDVPKKALKKIPGYIKNEAEIRTQKIKLERFNSQDEIIKEFEKKSRYLFKEYKNHAKLVITKRIHVAMPCIAMGIPVVFIHKNPQNARFDVLHGLTELYSYKNVKNIPYNNIKAIDIEKYKKLIINNALFQLNKSCPDLNIEIPSKEPRKELEEYTQKLALQYLRNTHVKASKKWCKKIFNKNIEINYANYIKSLTQNAIYEKTSTVFRKSRDYGKT